MCTVDCADPNCVKCKEAFEGQSSGEENRGKIPETEEQSSLEECRRQLLRAIQEVIANDLYSAAFDRNSCLTICRRLKEEVHSEFSALINTLRERELELCLEIEREYAAQVQKIDEAITASCADKNLEKGDGNVSLTENVLTFTSDFNYMQDQLIWYGCLEYKDIEKLERIQDFKDTVEKCSQFQADTEDTLSSGSSSEWDFKTTSRSKNATLVSSPSLVEVNHKEIKRELEEQKHMESTSDVDSDLNSIKNESGRMGSATDDDSEFSYDIIEDSDVRLLYDKRKVREIVHHLRKRKCLAPAVADKLNRNCEKISTVNELSVCLRDLSMALQLSAKPSIRRGSKEDQVKKYKNLEMENLSLKNIIKSLVKSKKENELIAIKNLEGKDCKVKTLQQLTRKDEPETLSAQIKKKYEVLANETIKDSKREEMACQSFESRDSVPDKEVKMSESSEKSMKGISAKFAVTDLERDQITSPSSENTDSSTSEEGEKNSSLDEDDIEIISRQEAESIPSDLPLSPPLPPKNKFRFGRKTSCVPSLWRKKVDLKPTEFRKHKIVLEFDDNGASKSQKNSLDSSSSNAETKENLSFNEKPCQKSPSECFDSSKDVGQDNDPTVALRSSFTKYLEKNRESEWLAPVKSSEQSKPAENSCKERDVPIFVQERDQRLPTEYNQKMASDWLHPAQKGF